MVVATTSAVKDALSDVTIGRLLLERGIINEPQLLEALRAQAAGGGRLGTILVRRGVLSETQLEAALRTQDEMRRAGVTVDLAVLAATANRTVGLALTVVVPPAGSQGGLPHHGVAARQRFLVPGDWLPATVAAVGPDGVESCDLCADDGRLLDYGIRISMRPSDDSLPVSPGRPGVCPRGESRDDGFEELTVLVTLAPDSLRDGGAGRFTGRFALRFG